jgi:pimeloyl-ACP methyl ester carboxylesterase
MIMGGAVMKINLKGQILMRLGSLTKSIIPYLVMYRFLAWVIMPRKNHRESRILFINEAKRLYQKEFIRWFTLVSQVNALLKLFRIKDSGIPTLYIMGQEDHMFLPSISKLVANHSSSKLVVVPNCGHVVNVEQPDFFNKSVIEFIQSV